MSEIMKETNNSEKNKSANKKSESGKSGKNKSGKKGKAWIVLMIICLAVAAVAAVQLVRILCNYQRASAVYDDLRTEVSVAGEAQEEEDHDWWDGETIDFDSLQAINPDLVAWIRFDNTDVINIDYPIAYSGDNDTYLHADIYGDYTYAGTLFFEGATEPFSTAKDIVYGHLMRDGSMFASLKKYTSDSSTYADNPFFTVYTPDSVRRYKIFSYFVTESGSAAYEYGFQKKTALFDEHLDWLCSESYISEPVKSNKDIMMLSTCAAANSSSRIVVFGKCIDEIDLTE